MRGETPVTEEALHNADSNDFPGSRMFPRRTARREVQDLKALLLCELLSSSSSPLIVSLLRAPPPPLRSSSPLLLFIISSLPVRILHFGLWLARSTNGIEAVAPLAEAIPYATGLALAIVGYAMVVISWTELVTAVKKMKADVKKSLTLFRRIVLIALAVSVPVLIILYIIQSVQPALNIVYNAFMGVFLLALACTQTYHGWTVRTNFNKMSNYKDVINGPQTRNNVLLAGTGVTFCLVIVLAYYPFGGFRYSASGFLAYQTIVRIGEWILCYIFILVIESYLTPFGWFRGYKLGLTLTGDKLEHIGAMTIAKTRTSRTTGSNQRSLADTAESYGNSSVAYGSSVAVSYTSAGNSSLTTSGSIAASVSG